MAREPGIGILRTVLEIARDANLVLCDLDIRIGFERLVEFDFAIAANLASAIGQLEDRAFPAHLLDHEFVDRHHHRAARAIGGSDGSAKAATPAYDRNVCAAGR